jgi:DNA-binding protein HU-beta
VNKKELRDHIAASTGITKTIANEAIDATLWAIRDTLIKGKAMRLVGFGTFSVGKRAARTCRNPRTGAIMKVKAKKFGKFRPSESLNQALKK